MRGLTKKKDIFIHNTNSIMMIIAQVSESKSNYLKSRKISNDLCKFVMIILLRKLDLFGIKLSYS